MNAGAPSAPPPAAGGTAALPPAPPTGGNKSTGGLSSAVSRGVNMQQLFNNLQEKKQAEELLEAGKQELKTLDAEIEKARKDGKSGSAAVLKNYRDQLATDLGQLENAVKSNDYTKINSLNNKIKNDGLKKEEEIKSIFAKITDDSEKAVAGELVKCGIDKDSAATIAGAGKLEGGEEFARLMSVDDFDGAMAYANKQADNNIPGWKAVQIALGKSKEQMTGLVKNMEAQYERTKKAWEAYYENIQKQKENAAFFEILSSVISVLTMIL